MALLHYVRCRHGGTDAPALILPARLTVAACPDPQRILILTSSTCLRVTDSLALCPSF